MGITFTVYTGRQHIAALGPRYRPADHPLAEWQKDRAGLKQRVQALNMVYSMTFITIRSHQGRFSLRDSANREFSARQCVGCASATLKLGTHLRFDLVR